jgi:low affinity Fe/Cu permease
MTPAKSASTFTRFAQFTAHVTGRPATFVFAALVIVVWAATGPIFHWSDTWQLIVNTGTTIITFLMVFLIQSTQNRDAVAVQVKLDELLRVSAGAHNVLMDLEELDEQELERIRGVYIRLAAAARRGVDAGRSDKGVPEIGDLASKTSSTGKSRHS